MAILGYRPPSLEGACRPPSLAELILGSVGSLDPQPCLPTTRCASYIDATPSGDGELLVTPNKWRGWRTPLRRFTRGTRALPSHRWAVAFGGCSQGELQWQGWRAHLEECVELALGEDDGCQERAAPVGHEGHHHEGLPEVTHVV
eukprot:8114351-Pyramimonas_sp.AAC.1